MTPKNHSAINTLQFEINLSDAVFIRKVALKQRESVAKSVGTVCSPHKLGRFCLLLSAVTLNVKVRKKAKQEGRVEKVAEQVANGQVGLAQHQLNVPEKDNGELEQLNLSDVLLPPEVLAHVWPYCGASIVPVHDHVNKAEKDFVQKRLRSISQIYKRTTINFTC